VAEVRHNPKLNALTNKAAEALGKVRAF